MGNFILFNPTRANELAKFQGTLAGTMAGQSNVTGVASAPTEVFNQAGYYAFQDSDTGIFQLQKLHEDSALTNEWYSQTLDKSFSFKNDSGSVFDLANLSSNMTPEEIANLRNY